MKLKLKKLTALALIFSLLTAAGCGRSKENNGNAPSASAMGRYVDREIEAPDAPVMYRIRRLGDGSLRIFGEQQIYHSDDQGETWETIDVTPHLDENEFGMINGACIGTNGDILFNYIVWDENYENRTSEFYYVDREGNKTVLDIEQPTDDFVDTMEFSGDQEVIVATNTGEFYRIDIGEETISDLFEAESWESDFCIVDNKVVVPETAGAFIYDLNSGEVTDGDNALKEQLKAYYSSVSGGSYNSEAKKYLLLEGNEEQTYYFAGNNGLFRQVAGGEIAEQVIDGNLCSLGDPSYDLVDMAELENNTYLFICLDSNYNYQLLRYVYDESVPSVPSQELKVYALEDNMLLRQSIIRYQEENPDVFVTLEVGMTGEDGITVSDATRTLNTEIMAGAGPDVVVLDGMPVDTYIEKGLLTDLSSLVDTDNDQEYFTQVLKTYQSDNGVYAVPTRFAMQVLLGSRDLVEAAQDLNSLAKAASELEVTGEEARLISMVQPKYIAALLYSTSSGAWMNADGTVDEAALEAFYQAGKDIYQAQADTFTETEFQEALEYEASDWMPEEGLASLHWQYMSNIVWDWMSDTVEFSIATIGSFDSYAYIAALLDENPDFAIAGFNGQQQGVFIPSLELGISTKSESADLAESFVSAMLSYDYQISTMDESFPVNRAAFENGKENPVIQYYAGMEDAEQMPFRGLISTRIDGETGAETEYELDVYWPEEKHLSALSGMLEELKTPAMTDRVLLEAVMKQTDDCFTGSITPQEAAGNVVNDVNIYLSE